MKKLFIISTLALLFSCSADTEKQTKENTNSSQSTLVVNFLNDVTSLEKQEGNQIVKFKEAVKTIAEQTITFNKENIEEVLSQAKEYKYCVITTGDHTIIKIDDVENCKPSGSWGACMPHAKGYIKKGELVAKEDYINNIMGIPDSQERIMYLFN